MNRDLFRPANGQLAPWYIFCDRTASADIRAFANRYRCDQLCIGTNKNIIFDERAMFVNTIVIAGNGAGADIDPLTDAAVTQVA